MLKIGISELVLILIGLIAAREAYSGETDDFDSLWELVSGRSHGIASRRSDYEASEMSVRRAKSHWAPKLSLNAQALSTNDPATTLFSNLGSRSLLASDLSPASMNEPPRQWFKRGSLVLDWAIYEGGSRLATLEAAKLQLRSKALSVESKTNGEFTRLAEEYAKLLSLRSELSAYSGLKAKLESLLDRYRVGSKANPVGYSGLLGMRSLMNRLEGSLSESRAEISSIENSIQTRAGREGRPLEPSEKGSADSFIDSKLSVHEGNAEFSSIDTESMRLDADARSAAARAERARWLPKVGLFASGNMTSGPRDSGNSTEYGGYLQWEIFNAANMGTYRESSLRAVAARENADEATQNSRIMRNSLAKSIPAIRENLSRIDDSLKYTAEQVAVTETLFRNGSINALQFVEVLSRRMDVIQDRRRAEFEYIKNVSAQYLQNARKK